MPEKKYVAKIYSLKKYVAKICSLKQYVAKIYSLTRNKKRNYEGKKLHLCKCSRKKILLILREPDSDIPTPREAPGLQVRILTRAKR